jgi:uncharacterized iron-regulated membrane protein
MAWLHTWSSLWACWVLFAVFLTGTLSVFDEDITRWMKPGLPPKAELAQMNADRVGAIKMAQAHLEKVAPQGHFWSVVLPGKDAAIRVLWEDDKEQFQQVRLDPATGKPAGKDAERETEGGHHFVHMHFEFHAGNTGIYLVGAFTMAMLVAMVSGIVIHKRIFKDFFTFRPRKAQRSWLDAHNALAVLTLPFQLMIAYTGLVIFYIVYMPAGIHANYPSVEAFVTEARSQPAHRDQTHIAAPMVRLESLVAQAEQRLGRSANIVFVEHPGDTSAAVRIFGPFDEGEDENFLLRPNGGSMTFDGTNGEILDVQMPRTTRGGGAMLTQRTMGALHTAAFGGYAIKWLYFFCGMAGTAMMATGAILFMVKRRQKALNEFGAATQRVYRWIDVLNTAAIAGLTVACVAYLWANRLVPLGIEQRAKTEIGIFFAIWALSVVHAALRPRLTAWFEQLAVAALLCIALPLLNWATTGAQFVDYLLAQDWMRAGVEIGTVVCGVLLAWTARLVRRKMFELPRRHAKPVPQPQPTAAAGEIGVL